MGYPVRAIGVLVLAAVAVTVACAVTAVGTILVVTLLIAPPLTARLWVDRSSRLFVLSAALGAGAGFLGLAGSAIWGLAGGAAVTLVSAGMLALSALSLPLRRHGQASRLRGLAEGLPVATATTAVEQLLSALGPGETNQV